MVLHKLSIGFKSTALQNKNLQVDGHVGTNFGGGCVCRCIHVIFPLVWLVGSKHLHTSVLLPACGARANVIERRAAPVPQTCPYLLLVHSSTVRVGLGWMTSAGFEVDHTGLMLVFWQLLLG